MAIEKGELLRSVRRIVRRIQIDRQMLAATSLSSDGTACGKGISITKGAFASQEFVRLRELSGLNTAC